MRRPVLPTVALALLASGAAAPIAAAEYLVVPERSGLAIVTHKAGIAAGLAHDHLVTAETWSAELRFDPDDPAATRCDVDVSVAGLAFDDPDRQDEWYPTIAELGVLDEPFSRPSEKDRGKIRDTALSRKQLDADTHPRIVGSLVSVRPAADGESMPWRATLRLEIHGESIERDVPARYDVADDGTVTLFAHGRLRFGEFGIEPYSAMLGAVKNRDEFDLLVRLVATPPAAPAADGQ